MDKNNPQWDRENNPNWNLEKKSNPKEKSKKTDPTLSDRSYVPDFGSHNNRWAIKRYRKNGFAVIPTAEYLMRGCWGVCKPPSGEIYNNRDQDRNQYNETEEHELLHTKGKNEYTVRFLMGDPNVANYC